jgi:hypothetical protein
VTNTFASVIFTGYLLNGLVETLLATSRAAAKKT